MKMIPVVTSNKRRREARAGEPLKRSLEWQAMRPLRQQSCDSRLVEQTRRFSYFLLPEHPGEDQRRANRGIAFDHELRS